MCRPQSCAGRWPGERSGCFFCGCPWEMSWLRAPVGLSGFPRDMGCLCAAAPSSLGMGCTCVSLHGDLILGAATGVPSES